MSEDCFKEVSGGSRHEHFFMGYNKLKEAQSWNLEDKILFAEQLILRELKNAKKPSVSCSWGKDSTALLYLVRKFCKRALVVFANTGVEYPETYAYRDKMLKEWKLNGTYFESKPIKHFWQCVDEYGFPTLRNAGEWKKGSSNPRMPRCCHYLKEKPLHDLQKKLGIDVVFRGMTASESMARRLLTLRKGYAYFHKSEKVRFVHPLVFWSDEDVYSFHKQENIPLNPIYKKTNRCGCMPCTGFTNWKEVMAKTSPKLYKYILQRKEGMQTIGGEVSAFLP
jgi:phosphoadenosine phosphosulfate reductase